MIRGVTLVMAVAVALVALGTQLQRPVPVAEACSYPPLQFERMVDDATLIALVEPIELGGNQNRAPTVVAEATATPPPGETPTPGGGEITPEPTETLVPAPATWTPTPEPDLTGMGARLRVIEAYHGTPVQTIDVDWERRALYEEYLRSLHALPPGSVNPCPPLAPMTYTSGTRYLVVLGHPSTDGLVTTMQFPIDGDDVVLGRKTPTGEEFANFPVRRATYDRYFSGMEAVFADDYATITELRMPLSTMLAAIAGVRGVVITPPDTGSAGLAAGR
jgi:hypothetical protein